MKKTVKTHEPISLIALLLFSICPFAAVAAEGRTEDRVGIITSFGSMPAPTLVGFGLGVNLTNFARFQAHVGHYRDNFSDVPVALYNNTAGLLLDFILGTFMRIIDPNFSLLMPYQGYNGAASHSFGANFFVPNWELSPMIGAHYGRMHISSGQPLNLSKSMNHMYYTVGVDYQGKSGAQMSAGVSYAPKIPMGNLAPFVSFGIFFL